MMKPIQQRFSISYAYDVLFTEHLFSVTNNTLVDALTRNADTPVDVFFVIDDGVHQHHPTLLADIDAYFAPHESLINRAGDPCIIPGGEDAKNDAAHTEAIQQAVYEHKICRHSFIVAIGGGAVLDMAGYAAATSHRGVRHIRIPTTVLSQNDSGVGVKNSVNAFGSKNFLGTFAPPDAVINDFNFLHTLDDRDWRAGISEAIKVALIKDPAFFTFIHENAASLAPDVRDMPAMQHLIHRCAALHVSHISAYGDPFERGSSRPLDFGHWAAHKLESITNFAIRHGEAVAIGIALDCCYAHLVGKLSEASLTLILQTFETLGFALYVPALSSHLDDPTHPQSLFRGLSEFREHLGGELTVLLLDAIGKSTEVHEVDYDIYRKAVAMLKSRETARNSLKVAAATK
ncbi:MAG: 3-dehydroquinate synthase [Bacteroidota bacterium]